MSRKEIRAIIDKLTDYVTKRTKTLGAKVDAGEITTAAFNVEMRELLKSAHIIAASVGKGGRQQMTFSDWGKVGRKLNWQYKYLDRFTKKLERKVLSKANTVNRARTYVNAVYISYAQMFQESQMVSLEPSGDQTKDENILVRLITNSDEGCPECAADEAEGWMKPEDMQELGTRICGDFCRCTLEFGDEL